MRCERLHCKLTEQACVRRQEAACNTNPPSICATCEQGRVVAEQLGVIVQRKPDKYATARLRSAGKRRRARRICKGETIWSSHYEASLKEVDDV